MAFTDARPFPQKNVAFRVTFLINDSNGDPATGAASLDSEVSKDAGAFADCTNEASEIGQGLYSLDLTATEMNADTVVVVVKSDQKQTSIVMYPEEAGDIRVNATQIEGSNATDQIRDAILDDATRFSGGNIDAAISSRLASADITLSSGEVTVGTSNDKTGYEISGSINTLDGLNDFDPSADSVTVDTVNDKTGYRLSATGVDDILDETYEGTTTFRQFLRVAAAALFGKSTGFGTGSVKYRDEADSKDRVSASVDTSGNRGSVTLDKD